jgi:hypothetical protein
VVKLNDEARLRNLWRKPQDFVSTWPLSASTTSRTAIPCARELQYLLDNDIKDRRIQLTNALET